MNMSSETVTDAQRDMRQAYYGGAPGILTSAMVWLAAAIVAVTVSPHKAVWALFIGGMLIHPVSVMWNKLIGRSGSHTAGNPLGSLAISGTVWMILMMPLAFAVSQLKIEWFFPAMLLIIGGRYLTFATMYGTRTYWFFGSTLVEAGVVLGLLHASPAAGAFTGAAVEAAFGLAIFFATRAGTAGAVKEPSRA